MDEDELICHWSGGPLRVYAVRYPMKPTGQRRGGKELYAPSTDAEWTLLSNPTDEATPYGEGLALLKPTRFTIAEGVWVDVEVRDGRPQLVKIESEPGGPELTHTLLRRLGSFVEAVRHLAVRLAVKDGEVVGITATSDTHPADFRSFAERTADIAIATSEATQRRGRPSDYSRVAQVAREARALRRGAGSAVAEAFNISLDAAKKRIKRAEAAGFDTGKQKEENDG